MAEPHTLCVDEVTKHNDSQVFDVVFSPSHPPAPLSEIQGVVDESGHDSFINVHSITPIQNGISYKYDIVIWYSFKVADDAPLQYSIVSKSSTQLYHFPSDSKPCTQKLDVDVTATFIPSVTSTNSITASVTSTIKYNRQKSILLEVDGTVVH